MENLGIDSKLLIAQLVNFAVFFVVFKFLIAKPFMNFLANDKRKELERDELTQKLTKGETILQDKEKELLKRIRDKQDEMMAEAKKDAEKQKEKILAQAHSEAEQVIMKAKEQIQAEREAMDKDIKAKVITMSQVIVEKGLTDFLNDDARRQVTKNILNHIPEKMTIH